MNGAAGVLFADARGRVLLVEPNYKPYWDLPGGLIEARESPRDAAAREIKEELGLVIQVGRLLVADVMPDGSLRFVFAHGFVPLGPGIELNTSELRSWAWCTPGNQRARQIDAPILARRVAAAREALTTGQTFYLESGRQVR